MGRAAILCVVLTVTACGVSDPLADLNDCEASGGGDYGHIPNYFADVASFNTVDSGDLRKLILEADVIGGDAYDITRLADVQSMVVVHTDERARGITTILLDERKAKDLESLDSGQTVYLGIWKPDGTTNSYVSMAAVSNDGDLGFAGGCVFYKSLSTYQDGTQLDGDLVSLFETVVADETAWSDFDEWHRAR